MPVQRRWASWGLIDIGYGVDEEERWIRVRRGGRSIAVSRDRGARSWGRSRNLCLSVRSRRSRFYQHFGTIDGLLSALAERRVQQIVDAMDEELDVRAGEGGPQPDGAEGLYASGGSPRSDDGPREITAFFTAVNRVLSVNFEVNRRLVECMSTESIVGRIREPLLDKLCARHRSVMELDARELGHAVDFMLGGLVSVYRTWVLKEDREPIECVSHRMEMLLAGSLRALLEEAEARSGTAGGV